MLSCMAILIQSYTNYFIVYGFSENNFKMRTLKTKNHINSVIY